MPEREPVTIHVSPQQKRQLLAGLPNGSATLDLETGSFTVPALPHVIFRPVLTPAHLTTVTPIPLPSPSRDDLAIDAHGRVMALSPDHVRARVFDMIDRGTILAVVVEVDEALAVQVFCAPSWAVVEALTTAAKHFSVVVRHAIGDPIPEGHA